MQLMHGLNLKPDSLEDGFAALWRHAAIRAEIGELLPLTYERRDTTVVAMPGLEHLPLQAHARYTRAEVFAALGISTISQPKEHREGVYFAEAQRIQLMFVTLNKDESHFASTIQYRDHAVAADLFHWESPNSWRQDGKAMLRCIGRGPGSSEHRLLFVRERTAGGIEGTFRCFGQVDLAGDLAGERPVALTWRLRQPFLSSSTSRWASSPPASGKLVSSLWRGALAPDRSGLEVCGRELAVLQSCLDALEAVPGQLRHELSRRRRSPRC